MSLIWTVLATGRFRPRGKADSSPLKRFGMTRSWGRILFSPPKLHRSFVGILRIAKDPLPQDDKGIGSVASVLSPRWGSRVFGIATHGSRRGLHSCAALRLGLPGAKARSLVGPY